MRYVYFFTDEVVISSRPLIAQEKGLIDRREPSLVIFSDEHNRLDLHPANHGILIMGNKGYYLPKSGVTAYYPTTELQEVVWSSDYLAELDARIPSRTKRLLRDAEEHYGLIVDSPWGFRAEVVDNTLTIYHAEDEYSWRDVVERYANMAVTRGIRPPSDKLFMSFAVCGESFVAVLLDTGDVLIANTRNARQWGDVLNNSSVMDLGIGLYSEADVTAMGIEGDRLSIIARGKLCVYEIGTDGLVKMWSIKDVVDSSMVLRREQHNVVKRTG